MFADADADADGEDIIESASKFPRNKRPKKWNGKWGAVAQ